MWVLRIETGPMEEQPVLSTSSAQGQYSDTNGGKILPLACQLGQGYISSRVGQEKEGGRERRGREGERERRQK